VGGAGVGGVDVGGDAAAATPALGPSAAPTCVASSTAMIDEDGGSFVVAVAGRVVEAADDGAGEGEVALIVTADEGADGDVKTEPSLARISATEGDEAAGNDTAVNSTCGGADVGADANRWRTAPTNSGHVGMPTVFSISSNHRSAGPVILKETVRNFRNSGVSHASKHWLQRCNQSSGSVLPSNVGMRILATAVVVSIDEPI